MKHLLKKLNVKDIRSFQVEGIETSDYPDFCDAYIYSAEVLTDTGWRDATEEELYIINEDRDLPF